MGDYDRLDNVINSYVEDVLSASDDEILRDSNWEDDAKQARAAYARALARLMEKKAMGPADELMRFFEYQHLPEHLQAVSRPFCELASVIHALPDNGERHEALRKLLGVEG